MRWRAHDDYEEMLARLREIAEQRLYYRRWRTRLAVLHDVLFYSAVFLVCLAAAGVASNGDLPVVFPALSAVATYWVREGCGFTIYRMGRRDDALASEERFWLYEQGRWWRTVRRRGGVPAPRIVRDRGDAA